MNLSMAIDDPRSVVAAEVDMPEVADLNHTLADLSRGGDESAATKSKTRIRCSLLALVEAVGQRGHDRKLVDVTLYVEAGDLARSPGGLTLGVIEVGGRRDNRVGNVLTEVGLGVALAHIRIRALISRRGVTFAVNLWLIAAHVA